MINLQFNSQYPVDWTSLNFQELGKLFAEATQIARARIPGLLAAPATFEDTILGLHNLDNEFAIITGLATELASVQKPLDSAAAVEKLIVKMSDVGTDLWDTIFYNQELFTKVKTVYDQREQLNYDDAVLTERMYKAFIENGVHLPSKQQKLITKLSKELSKLEIKIESLVQKDTNRRRIHITDATQVRGLSEDVVAPARKLAQQKGRRGYLFEVDDGLYHHALEFSESPEFRKQVFQEFRSLGRQGPYNTLPLIKQVLKLRARIAKIMGYRDYATAVFKDRMAGNLPTVKKFIRDLYQQAKPKAQQELQTLRRRAQKDGLKMTRADVSFYERKAKEAELQLDFNSLKAYFPKQKVWLGLQTLLCQLYGLKLVRLPEAPVYHPSVEVYAVYDHTGRELSLLYLDLYTRPEKQSGAWMNGIITSKPGQVGVIVVAADFIMPEADSPGLLSLTDVRTLFHEIGHALHEALSQAQYDEVAGTNVAWDFVELPSQIMENFIFTSEGLSLITGHFETGEPMPAELVEKLIKSNQLYNAHNLCLFLGLAALDVLVHTTAPAKLSNQFVDKFFNRYILLPYPEGTGRLHSFTHIFGGDYDLGYYSYMWAEVLDADCFEAFKAAGVISAEVGERFRREVLSRGSSRPEMESFKAFRGRAPEIKPYLVRLGLETA